MTRMLGLFIYKNIVHIYEQDGLDIYSSNRVTQLTRAK